MSNEENYDFDFGKEVDDDYIGVEPERAPVSYSDEPPSTADGDEVRLDAQTADASGTVDDGPHWNGVEQRTADKSHAFDDGGGAGASTEVDELIDANAVTAHDGRAVTRTFFYTADAPEHRREKFKRLYRHQEGVGDPDRRSHNRPAERRRMVSIFCSHLDMSEYHHDRVIALMESIEMSHMAHYSAEKVILAIISLVANEDNRFIRDEDGYRDLMGSVETDLREVRKIRQLIRVKSGLM